MSGIWDLGKHLDATKDRVKWKHYVTTSSSAAGRWTREQEEEEDGRAEYF